MPARFLLVLFPGRRAKDKGAPIVGCDVDEPAIGGDADTAPKSDSLKIRFERFKASVPPFSASFHINNDKAAVSFPPRICHECQRFPIGTDIKPPQNFR